MGGLEGDPLTRYNRRHSAEECMYSDGPASHWARSQGFMMFHLSEWRKRSLTIYCFSEYGTCGSVGEQKPKARGLLSMYRLGACRLNRSQARMDSNACASNASAKASFFIHACIALISRPISQSRCEVCLRSPSLGHPVQGLVNVLHIPSARTSRQVAART